jgi:2-polyprenyl-3-methyl-5-hydroxy-6-metoxy-1,4-benzoquinol methylase
LSGKIPETSDFFEFLFSIKRDPWNYENSPYEKEKYQTTLSALPREKYRRVLEVGCAIGVFTQMLKDRAESILAVDVSSKAVDAAIIRNQGNNKIEFKKMDVEKEEPGELFDLIVCSEVLYYLDDTDRIAGVRDRFIRWVEPGGQILLVHMRRQADDDSGFPANFLGYPSLGANTVHGVFNDSPFLKLIKEIKKPLYTVSIYEHI